MDEDDAPASPCPVGSTLAPYTWQMFQDLEDVSRCRERAYITILALTDGLKAILIELETREDVVVPPHPLGSTTMTCLENKVPTPCPLCLESIL